MLRQPGTIDQVAMCAGRRSEKSAAVEVRIGRTHSLDILPIEYDIACKRRRRKSKSKIKTNQRPSVLKPIFDPIHDFGSRPSAPVLRWTWFQSRCGPARIGNGNLEALLPRLVVARPIDADEAIKSRRHWS